MSILAARDIAPSREPLVAERTALYRVWGKDDLLLYIGISDDFGRRWKQHAKQQLWWDEMKRLTADEWFDTRDDAEFAETVAIRTEKPKYNIAKAVRALEGPSVAPALWVGEGGTLAQIERIITSSGRSQGLAVLMIMALIDGYREIPRGVELQALAAKVGMSRSSAYDLVRKSRDSRSWKESALGGSADIPKLGKRTQDDSTNRRPAA